MLAWISLNLSKTFTSSFKANIHKKITYFSNLNIISVCENPSQGTILEPLCYSSLATLVIVFKV